MGDEETEEFQESDVMLAPLSGVREVTKRWVDDPCPYHIAFAWSLIRGLPYDICGGRTF